jgi:tetratricopeptide (TPR) repeat protein
MADARISSHRPSVPGPGGDQPAPAAWVRTARGPNRMLASAMTRAARGEIAGAIAAWRTATAAGASPSFVERLGPVMARIEGRIAPDASPPPPAPEAPRAPSPAWALAWAGDLDAARALAEGSPEDPAAAGVIGAVLLAQRRPAAALPLLDRALAGAGGDGARADAHTLKELALHRVHALVQLGLLDDAERSLAAQGDGETFARRVLVGLVEAHRWANAPKLPLAVFAEWCRHVARSEVHLNGFFSSELPAVVGARAVAEGLASPPALVALLEGVVARLSCNLGPSPTFAERAPGGAKRFVPLRLPPSARDEAVEALASLRQVGPRGAAAAFAELMTRRPRSVHALCYRGELELWLGRYDEALRCFRAARRIEPARWADVGTLAVLTLTGRYARALAMARLAERRFPAIPRGTLPVYRGVLRRRVGELDGAIEDLRHALAVKPTRVGARIELCLALRARGLREEATAQAAELARDAAPLLVDVADGLSIDWPAEPARLVGDDVLEASLAAMRGNRSSMIPTWVGHGGEMRLLHARHLLQSEAARACSESG